MSISQCKAFTQPQCKKFSHTIVANLQGGRGEDEEEKKKGRVETDNGEGDVQR